MVLLSVVGTMKADSSIFFAQCPFVTVEVSVLNADKLLHIVLHIICKAVNEQKKAECNSSLKQPYALLAGIWGKHFVIQFVA